MKAQSESQEVFPALEMCLGNGFPKKKDASAIVWNA